MDELSPDELGITGGRIGVSAAGPLRSLLFSTLGMLSDPLDTLGH